jgi:mRNA interferase RelE/StbE
LTNRYEVELSKRAAKELRKLDRRAQERLLKALVLLRENPRPPVVKSLSGHPGYLRVRVGEYRIVYTVDDGKLIVLVLTVGHRRGIYDALP